MGIRRIGKFSCWSVILVAALGSGCVPQPKGDGTGGSGTGSADEVPGRPLPVFDDRDLDPPAEQPVPDAENSAPTGSLVFPPADVAVARGEVVFRWVAVDPDQTNVDSRLFIGEVPHVFENPSVTLGLRTPPDENEHGLSVRFPDAGTFYWGVEITDGINSVQLPFAATGQRFEVSVTRAVVIGADDVVLLCPRETQPARAQTTFQWSLGAVVPVRAQVFVGRPDQENPFDSPLRVFEVSPPAATSRTLTPDEALPLGEELSWGLRLETAGEVRFTFEGQLGNLFVVGENVPPAGELLGPDDDAVMTDGTEAFILSWAANAGNCEDEVTSTVFFERLGASDAPTALFESDVRLPVTTGVFQVDLAPGAAILEFVSGRWAWGVLADDGTHRTELTTGPARDRSYRTFFIDGAPQFLSGPSIGRRSCGADGHMFDAIVFRYTDDNGDDTVTVRLSYAVSEAELFAAAAATLELTPEPAGAEVVVFLQRTAARGCLDFANGAGFYGVQLDDGRNQPVRATLRYGGPPTGACCAADGSCTEVPFEDCPDGAYQGDGTDCASADCPQPTGACCAPNGSCTEVVFEDCIGGVYQGDGITCAEVSCPRPLPPPPPPPPDCNGNGIPDGDDIANQSSPDCNGDRVPDECEIEVDSTAPGGPFFCMTNCDPDCNGTGIPDACELVENDCNVNGIPDECEAGEDCNANDVQDICDIFTGTSEDCNANAVPDECDLEYGTSWDCNGNNIPDECEGGILIVDAGTLPPGVIGDGVYYSDWDNNHLVGTICPPQVQPNVLWEQISSPPGDQDQTTINTPTDLTTAYHVDPAVPGDYVFQLTFWLGDPPVAHVGTVTLTLTEP